jgi:hypothetical protein
MIEAVDDHTLTHASGFPSLIMDDDDVEEVELRSHSRSGGGAFERDDCEAATGGFLDGSEDAARATSGSGCSAAVVGSSEPKTSAAAQAAQADVDVGVDVSVERAGGVALVDAAMAKAASEKAEALSMLMASDDDDDAAAYDNDEYEDDDSSSDGDDFGVGDLENPPMTLGSTMQTTPHSGLESQGGPQERLQREQPTEPAAQTTPAAATSATIDPLLDASAVGADIAPNDLSIASSVNSGGSHGENGGPSYAPHSASRGRGPRSLRDAVDFSRGSTPAVLDAEDDDISRSEPEAVAERMRVDTVNDGTVAAAEADDGDMSNAGVSGDGNGGNRVKCGDGGGGGTVPHDDDIPADAAGVNAAEATGHTGMEHLGALPANAVDAVGRTGGLGSGDGDSSGANTPCTSYGRRGTRTGARTITDSTSTGGGGRTDDDVTSPSHTPRSLHSSRSYETATGMFLEESRRKNADGSADLDASVEWSVSPSPTPRTAASRLSRYTLNPEP